MKRKAFLLRLDPKTHDALQRWAKDDLRSVNGQIEFLLRRALQQLEGGPYPAYKDITGTYAGPDFTLHADHIQGDPFADPSRIRVILGTDAAGLPGESFATRPRTLGTACFLARTFAHRARSASRRHPQS